MDFRPLLTAHIGYLYKELPVVDRVAAAAAGGFTAVDLSDPLRFPAEALKAAAASADISFWQTTTSFSVDDGPGAGLAALAGMEALFEKDCNDVLRAAELLGVRWVHVMAGCPVPNVEAVLSYDVYCRNIRRASQLFGSYGIGILIEQINAIDLPGYFITDLSRAIDILDDLGDPNISLLFDTYNIGRSGIDVVDALTLAKGHIGHVQLADNPGRHEPGTGSIDFPSFFRALSRMGYAGRIACEYHPLGETEEGLSWIPQLLAPPPGVGSTRAR